MNQRPSFCSRKGGATIKGKFHPLPRTSEILARQIERTADKLEARRLRYQRRFL